MGTAAFERDSVVEINSEKYRVLRKVSDTCWQLEHTKTARISELEPEQLLKMYADRKLRFANAVGGTGSGIAHIEISETARLRRMCAGLTQNGHSGRPQAGHLGRVA